MAPQTYDHFTKVAPFLKVAQTDTLRQKKWRKLRNVLRWRKSRKSYINIALLLLAKREHHQALRRERLFRDRTNPLNTLVDHEIQSRYMFTREVVFCALEELGDVLEHRTRVIFKAIY